MVIQKKEHIVRKQPLGSFIVVVATLVFAGGCGQKGSPSVMKPETSQAAADGQPSNELFATKGDVSRAGSGWSYEASDSKDGMVYIPFEGVYPDKGGRIQSPWFTIPDNEGSGAYYRVKFKARSAEHCYWWLDYRDKDGQRIPDCNSKVYPGPEIREYDEVVYVPGAVRSVQIAFVTKGKVEASDVSFIPATPAEAAEWCDNLYSTLPPLNFSAPADSMALLPRTAAALNTGKPWRIVMLGNSHMNDAFNSMFTALVRRDFPNAHLDVVASVRGQTGNSFYRQPENFEQYIAAQKPDLLITLDTRGGEDLAEVVRLTREKVGCEIIVVNGGMGGDWRTKNESRDWRNFANDSGRKQYDVDSIRESAKSLNIAFWDLTTPANDYLAAAPADLDIGRDYTHSNNIGKQITGRILHQYFLTAKESRMEVFRNDGEISQPGSGWTYQPSDAQDGKVYIPFEGVYPDKGGRTQSPIFPIPENELGAYYRLTFKARSADHCYWWLDYFDKDGNHIPDCNSKVYPGDELRDYDEVVYVQGAARTAQIAFVSKAKVEVRNVVLSTATQEEAVKWADDLYKTLPPLNFTAPADAMALLPKTSAALKTGKPWRVVMLGHSLMNDTFNSLFMALVKEDFPLAQLDVRPSVRGSTGNSFYKNPEEHAKYVVAKKPDLLIIGDNTGTEDLEEVIRLTREKVGCEILVINYGLAGDWREREKTLDWRSLADQPRYLGFNVAPVRDCAKKLNVAFWDVTTPCQDWLVGAGEVDFGRDYVHNNDVGKQIIGRVLYQYFLTARPSPVELFRFNGEISQPNSGWTYQPSDAKDGMVYIPFEGVYPDKGGRTQSQIFPIRETDGLGSYYRLTFKARSADHCYWWLDYFGKNGNTIPDCNSKVYPGEELRSYDEVVYVPGAVRSVQIAFVSKAKVEASDIVFTTATAEEAAQWCDDLYKTLPPLNFTAPKDSMVLLPKTVAAMHDGTPWRVVLLGASIQNDTFNSLFMSLVQRDFPQARIDVVASVRGSTGNSFFKNLDEFEKYVVAKKPDLLIISDRTGSPDMEEVVRLAREKVGCEILITNGPLAGDWREREKTLDWRSLADQPRYQGFNIAPVRDCAKKLNLAFWDLTTPCQDWLAGAGNVDFGRDYVHNNDVGKQIIGRVLYQYFLTAKQ